MLGAGLFINTTVLAQIAGMLGALSYVLIGILMLPLIGSFMQLMRIHPTGGFYTFGSKEIHPFVGFIGAWTYATGKLASATIMIHISILFLQTIFPALAPFNPLYMDAGVIGSFIALNMFDIRTNSNIQSGFFVIKLIPVLFGILVGMFLWLGGPSHPMLPNEISGIPFTLPLVLFALIGFEAVCSLGSRIQDSRKNGPRAIMISYFLIISLSTLYQLMISGALGTMLEAFADYRDVFPGLFSLMPSMSEFFRENLTSIIHLAIASSALAGAYGIIFSNTWNWYTLAQHRHLFAADKITQLNRYQIPWICVWIQGAICIAYLIVSRGSQLPLQQTAVFGVTIGYTISIIALLAAQKNRTDLTIKKWVPFLAFGNCLLLLGSIVYSLIIDGATSLFAFSLLILFGCIMFWLTPGKLSQLDSNQSEQT